MVTRMTRQKEENCSNGSTKSFWKGAQTIANDNGPMPKHDGWVVAWRERMIWVAGRRLALYSIHGTR